MRKIYLFILSLLMLLTISLSSCDSTVTVYDINKNEITISSSIYKEYVTAWDNRYGYSYSSIEDSDSQRTFTTYLGEYNNGYYFTNIFSTSFGAVVNETIAGINFHYGSTANCIYYLYDGVLYALNEAYEHFLLTKDEIERLHTFIYSVWVYGEPSEFYNPNFLSFGTFLEDKVEFNKDIDEDNIIPGYIVLKIDNNFVNNDLESYFKNNSYTYEVNNTDIILSFSHQLNYETIVMKLNEELDLDELEILANQLLEEDLFKEVEVLTKDYSVEIFDDTQIIFDFDNIDASLYKASDNLLIDIKPSMINYNYRAYFSQCH